MLDSLSPSKGAQQWLRSLQSGKNFISAPVWAALTSWQWALQKHTQRRDWVVGLAFTVLLAPTQWTFETQRSVETRRASWSPIVTVAGGRMLCCGAFLHNQLLQAEAQAPNSTGWLGTSDVVPVAPAKQIVFLVLLLYTVTKKVTGLAENDVSGPEQVIHFWWRFAGSHFSFVLVLFYWWNNDSEACPASSLRCLCSLVAVWFSDQWQLLGSFMMDPFLTQRFVDGAACLLGFCKGLCIIFFSPPFCVKNRPL